MALISAIGQDSVGLDTAIFIYYIEEHPHYLPLVEPVLAGIDEGRRDGVTSAVTLLETLVIPYRTGDVALAERYEALLARSRGLRLVDLDRPLLRAAAQLRATAGLKTPDALQIAAALRARCGVFLTNDRTLPSISGIRVLQLRDFARG